MSYLHQLINRFSEVRVLVVGDMMLDEYLYGQTTGICREAPVPIVRLSRIEKTPGGAAHTAVSLAALGAQVTLAAVGGQDANGEWLKARLQEDKVKVKPVLLTEARQTLVKKRVVTDNQILLRYDYGSNAGVENRDEAWIAERLQQLYPLYDVIVLSDYGAGLFSKKIIQTLAKLQQTTPKIVVGDSRKLARLYPVHPHVVKPNYEEAVTLLGLEAMRGKKRIQQMRLKGTELLDRTGAEAAVVTLDKQGCVVFERGREPYHLTVKPTDNIRAIGAGDSFISALALGMGAGGRLLTSVRLALTTTEVVLGKEGTALCSRDELLLQLTPASKIVSTWEELASMCEMYRKHHKKIVFTNGCFDLLHPGHTTYLEMAKKEGDILIVGVNSDESVRKLKGTSRPINKLTDRMKVLAALGAVDHVVSFTEATPIKLIKMIKPDLFVKGGDYTRETLPEAAIVEALGGSVKILPLLPNRSTTNIISKIHKQRVTAYETHMGLA